MSEDSVINRTPQRYPKLSNDLLRAAHQSGLQEMKIILLAASKLPQEKDAHFDPLTPIYITRDDAIKIGFNPSNVARDLRIACSNLRAREVTIPTPLGDKVTGWVYNLLFFKTEVFQQLKEKYPTSRHDDAFINQLRIHNLLETLPFVMKSDEDLMARIIMHPDILPFLVQLKENYTQFDLLELTKLTDSIYSFRIFLLLMEWKSTGVVHKKIEELRREFMLQDKYENTKDLRRRVIDTAINEINEKTAWQVSYTLKKTGRKFTHLELKFKEKKTKVIDVLPSRDPKTVDWINGVSDDEIRGMTPSQAIKYAQKLHRVHDIVGNWSDCNDYEQTKSKLIKQLQQPLYIREYMPFLLACDEPFDPKTVGFK